MRPDQSVADTDVAADLQWSLQTLLNHPEYRIRFGIDSRKKCCPEFRCSQRQVKHGIGGHRFLEPELSVADNLAIAIDPDPRPRFGGGAHQPGEHGITHDPEMRHKILLP